MKKLIMILTLLLNRAPAIYTVDLDDNTNLVAVVGSTIGNTIGTVAGTVTHLTGPIKWSRTQELMNSVLTKVNTIAEKSKISVTRGTNFARDRIIKVDQLSTKPTSEISELQELAKKLVHNGRSILVGAGVGLGVGLLHEATVGLLTRNLGMAEFSNPGRLLLGVGLYISTKYIVESAITQDIVNSVEENLNGSDNDQEQVNNSSLAQRVATVARIVPLLSYNPLVIAVVPAGMVLYSLRTQFSKDITKKVH